MPKNREPKIYHVRSPWRLAVKILLAVLAVLLAFFIFLFVYFQRFIVITEDGLKLDIAGYYAQEETSPQESGAP